jgi:hypothetical protein
MWRRSVREGRRSPNCSHLEGNVRQWILSASELYAISVTAPEFSARSGANASVLLAKLRGTVGEALVLIRSLAHRRLADEVSISAEGYNIQSPVPTTWSRIQARFQYGEVAEWSMAVVLKN